MKVKPPVLLILVVVAYLAYLAFLLITGFTPIVAGRFALSVLLFFFVLRGSRTAGNVLALLSTISAIVLLIAALATFSTNYLAAVVFAIIAALLLAFSAYLFFSPSVRAFQGRTIAAG